MLNPNTPISPSFRERLKIFQKVSDGTFPQKSVRFVGYVYTDLKTLLCGIPHGIEVRGHSRITLAQFCSFLTK